jgi:hypothetical protein
MLAVLVGSNVTLLLQQLEDAGGKRFNRYEIKNPLITERAFLEIAERKGFEPSIGLHLYQLSRRALSTTQAPL